ncbi:hypothetical protein E4U11_002058 [Claviceps purpurea]|nr:hypothetical protein E4U11_002058 [Claviceps purpurea]
MEDNPDSLESAQQRDDAPKVFQQGFAAKKSANQEERQPRRAPTKKSAHQYHRMLCSIDALSVFGNS